MEIVQDETQSAPKFDPTKQYRWNADTEFTFKGQEFALVMNSLRAFLSTEDAQIVQLAARAAQTIEMKLASAVESGEAREITAEELQAQQQAAAPQQ